MSTHNLCFGADAVLMCTQNTKCHRMRISNQIFLKITSIHEDVFNTNIKKKHFRNGRASLGRDYSKVSLTDICGISPVAISITWKMVPHKILLLFLAR